MCDHTRTEVTEFENVITTAGGPEYDITSYTCCLDCGAEVEAPVMEWLARDCEPTVYEIENDLVSIPF